MANAKKVLGLCLTIGGAIMGILGTIGYIAIVENWILANYTMRDYVCKPVGFIGAGICLIGIALLVWNYISKKMK